MKRAGLAVLTALLMLTATVHSQSLRMVADINATNSLNELVVTGRTVFNGKIHFCGNDGRRSTLYTLDAGGASMLLPQLDAMRTLHNGGGHLVFWADDGSNAGNEPWATNGTVSGTVLLDNLCRLDPATNASSLEGGYVTMNGQSYFGAFESFRMKPSGPVWDFGLYRTDGTAKGTVELCDDLDVQKMVALNGSLIIDALDMISSSAYGRELFIHNGSGTVPIGTMTPGPWGMEDDNPYTQWYSRHVYRAHEPVAAAGCAFFNSRNQYEGNELWCTDGSTLRMVTGTGNGSHSTYPVFMTVLDGVLYFVGLDVNDDSELWSFPLNDPMNSGTAGVLADVNPSGSSEPAWMTVYDGDLYFSAYTATTGRELYRYDGSSVQLVADIAVGTASSNPHYAPDAAGALVGISDYGTPGRFSFTEFNGKLYFAADDGTDGMELWSFDAATNTAALVWDVNPGTGGSDPHFLTVYNGRLYFTAYTPQYGRAWYEYDPGGSTVNQSPVAAATAPSVSGLTVQFSASGSYDPDGTIDAYAWDFGDAVGSSTQPNPTYTYGAVGTYTATLTVTDNSSATGTDDVTVTVSIPQSGTMYLSFQTVTRVTLPGNKIAAEDAVVIREYPGGEPVEGALVTASYYSATTGTVSGTTSASGEVTLTTAWDRNPVGSWCFNVTNVQKSGYTYDETQNAVPKEACEAAPKSNRQHPSDGAPSAASCVLHQNHPNPFGAIAQETVIRVELGEAGNVQLHVHDAYGRRVRTLVDGYLPAGSHVVRLHASGLPAGMLFCGLVTSHGAQQMRMIVLR